MMKNLFFLFSVGLVITTMSCSKDKKRFIEDNRKDILNAFADEDSVEADGKSFITIRAKISKDADKKTVKFSTNKGRLIDSSLTYTTDAAMENDVLIAKAFLTPGLEAAENVIVNVSVPEVSERIGVRFVNAFPDAVQIESTVATVQNTIGATVPLNIYLIRKTGIPSLHQKVRFRVLKQDGSEMMGDLRGIDPAGSNDKGLITATYILEDSTYSGKLKIISIADGKQQQVYDTVTIFITK